MHRILSIATAILLSALMYWGIALLLKRESVRAYVRDHGHLHPNAICGWRVLIGLLGMLFYFVWHQSFTGILLFTISAFLDGVDGLVHISDLSWKRISHPSEVVKKGDEVEAIITNIDAVNQRLSLSMKALMPDIWDEFFRNHYVGDIVHGKVTKLVDFGAFVELGDGVEGLVHISELSDKHISDCAEVVNVGESYPFKVIRLEPSEKRIGLSLKEGQRREQQAIDRDVPVPDYAAPARSSTDESRVSLGDVADFSGLTGLNAQKEEPEEEPAAESPEPDTEAGETAASADEATPAPVDEAEKLVAEALADVGVEPQEEPEAQAETKDEADDEAEPAPEDDGEPEPSDPEKGENQ